MTSPHHDSIPCPDVPLTENVPSCIVHSKAGSSICGSPSLHVLGRFLCMRKQDMLEVFLRLKRCVCRMRGGAKIGWRAGPGWPQWWSSRAAAPGTPARCRTPPAARPHTSAAAQTSAAPASACRQVTSSTPLSSNKRASIMNTALQHALHAQHEALHPEGSDQAHNQRCWHACAAAA